MNNMGTKTIQTPRLILRKITLEDAADMYNNWASDEEVTKYLTWKPHGSIDDSREYIASLHAKYADPEVYDWGIELKSINRLIGSISAVRVDDNVEIVHIGYCIGRKWWNSGITSEAFAAVIDFLMNQVGANRIESRHDPRNAYSGAVMKKCGLKYEGTLKESDRNNQGVCDADWYAILKREYFCRKQAGATGIEGL